MSPVDPGGPGTSDPFGPLRSEQWLTEARRKAIHLLAFVVPLDMLPHVSAPASMFTMIAHAHATATLTIAPLTSSSRSVSSVRLRRRGSHDMA